VVTETGEGLRAVSKGEPVTAESAERYLDAKFGPNLARVRAAMEELAAAFPKDVLAARGFALYEKFRPGIPEGVKGWGAKGKLDLELLARLAAKQG
jgi:hypothetical protein